MSAPLRPGHQTTEYKIAQSSSFWSAVAIVLGGIIMVGSQILSSMDPTTKWGIIIGAVVTIAGVIQKTLISLGYIRSRTEIKRSAVFSQGSRKEDV